MALEFIFDARSQRYRYKDSGKFVGQEAVRNLTQKAIDQVTQDISTIGDLLANGKISVGAWEEETAKALKNLYTWSYLLGAGGQKNVGAREYGILGAEIKRQYKYLRKFSEHLVSTGMSEPQFHARLQLYTSAATNIYERGRLEAHAQNGYQWERRHRTKPNSCQDCIDYEGSGWQPLGSLPNPGRDCRCQSNCGCFKEFSKDTARPADSLTWGWVGNFNYLLKKETFTYGNNNTNRTTISPD